MHNTQLFGRDQYTKYNVLKATDKGIDNQCLKQISDYQSYGYGSLLKKHMDFCSSHYLHQLIAEPTKTTYRTKTLLHRVLVNSPEKVIQSGVTETGLFDHELIHCRGKTSLLKLDKLCETSMRPIKNYSHEIFVKQLRPIKFPY